MSLIKDKKNKVVRAWVYDHIHDPYVRQAQKDGYRSRAAYKLLEADAKYGILSGAKRIVDLGCVPGSWSQVAIKLVGDTGVVVGVDLLPIEHLHKLRFIQGDFTNDETLDSLVDAIGAKMVDVVLSDMAPNLSGVKGVDQARGAYLVELVLDFAANYLKVGGHCLMKAFQGGEFDKLVKMAQSMFLQVVIYKPDSSKSKSSELYLVCKQKI